MKYFFVIWVLPALFAVGNTQPTHDSQHQDEQQTKHHSSESDLIPEHETSQPEYRTLGHSTHNSHHHDERQTQHHSPESHMIPEHEMSHPEYRTLRQPTHNSPQYDERQTQHHSPESHMIPEHEMSHPEYRTLRQPTHNSYHHDERQTQHHSPESHLIPEHEMSQPEYTMIQPERISNSNDHISHPHYSPESWLTAKAQANAQSQTWISPEPHYKPVEILPHHINRPDINHAPPHISHSQLHTIDPQFGLHHLIQHPHYLPTARHHTLPIYPTHGWNTHHSDDQQPLPEAAAPEQHHTLEVYPTHSSAFANSVATSSSDSVPVPNNEPAHKLYRIYPISKADDGADYIMPVADHETKKPKVIQVANEGGLPDIVKKILERYRPKSIDKNPEPQKTNNVSAHNEHKPEDPVQKTHKHKHHRVPIPEETKTGAKTKTIAKTGADKRLTFITGGKYRTTIKANHKHKHSHTKEEPSFHLPDQTREKDIPCDDKPIVNNDNTNPSNADCEDELNLSDKNKPKDEHKDKHHHKKYHHLHSSADTTNKQLDDLINQKDSDRDADYDSAKLDKTLQTSDNNNASEKINDGKNTNSKPIDSKIKNYDIKAEEIVEKIKKEESKKVQIEEEKIHEIDDYKPDRIDTKSCDDKPIVNNDSTNPSNANCEDELNLSDKNKPKDEHKDKHHHKKHHHLHSSADTTNKQLDDLINQKDSDRDADYDSAKLDKTLQTSDNNNASEKINDGKNTNSKPVDSKIKNYDIKAEEIVEKIKKEESKKVQIEEEKIHEIDDYKPDRIDTKSCDDKPIVNNDSTNPSNANCEDELNLSDKNKPKDEHKDKHHHKKHHHLHSSADTTNKQLDDLINQKDSDRDPDYDSAKLDKTLQTSDNNNASEKINDGKNTNSKPVDSKIKNYDIKAEEIVEKVKKEESKKVQIEEEKIHEIDDYKPDRIDTKSENKNVPEEGVKTELSRKNETNKKETLQQASEHQTEIKTPLPKAKTEDNKSVSPDFNKDNKDSIEKDVKKGKETKEVLQIVETKEVYKTTESLPESKKDIKNLESEKQDDNSSDSEDCDSSPEGIKDSKEPSSKVNKRGEDLDKIKEIEKKKKMTVEVEKTHKVQEKEIKRKTLLRQPQTYENLNTESESEDKNKGNKNTKTEHKFVPIDKVKTEESRNDETRLNDKLQQSKKNKQQLEINEEYRKPVENDSSTSVSDHSSEFSEHQKEIKKPLLKGNTEVNKPVSPHFNKGNKELIKNDVEKVKDTKEVARKVETKEVYKTTEKLAESKKESKNIELGKQDNNSSDIEDCDSAPEDIKNSKEPLSKVNKVNEYLARRKEIEEQKKMTVEVEKSHKAQEKENKGKNLQEIKTDGNQNTESEPVVDKGNKITKTEHKFVPKEKVKTEESRNDETRKHETLQKSKKIKQLHEINDEHREPVRTSVSDECESSEHQKEIKKPLLKANPEDKKPLSPDYNKENKDFIKKDVKKAKDTKEVARKVETKEVYKTTEKLPESKKDIKNLESGKQDYNSSDIEDCDSAPEDIKDSKKPLSKVNKVSEYLAKRKEIEEQKKMTVEVEKSHKTQEKEYKRKKLLHEIKTDGNQNTESEPVVHKGNKITKTENKFVPKEKVKTEESRNDETRINESLQKSKNNKQLHEINDEHREPVEKESSTSVSDECHSSESSEHQKEIKKPLLKGNTEDNKPVSPDFKKENKDLINKDVKKVEDTKEVAQKVKTKEVYKTTEKLPESTKDIKNLESNKQDDNSSDIEDCDSSPEDIEDSKESSSKVNKIGEDLDKIKRKEKKKKMTVEVEKFHKVQEKEIKRKTLLREPKTDEIQNTESEPENKDKRIKNTKTENKFVPEEKVKTKESRNDETRINETLQKSKKNKQLHEINDEHQEPVEKDSSTSVSDECHSSESSEHQKEVKKPLLKGNTENNKPISTDFNKENKDLIKKDVKKVKDRKEVAQKVETKEVYKTKEKLPESKKDIKNLESDKQNDNSSDIEDCDSSPEYIKDTKEPLSKVNKRGEDLDKIKGIEKKNKMTVEVEKSHKVQEKEIKRKTLLREHKTDEIQNTESEPENKDKRIKNTKTEHKFVPEEKVKTKEGRNEETRLNETLQKSKQKKQQSVENDCSTSVSDECFSGESSEHQKEIKKPPLKANTEDNKPVSSGYTNFSRGENKDSIKKEVIKVKDTKEVAQKVETKEVYKENKDSIKKDVKQVKNTKEVETKNIHKTTKSFPESKKDIKNIESEKHDDSTSDIEDCDLTESNKPQRPYNKNRAPEDIKELKAKKENKGRKDLVQRKKIGKEIVFSKEKIRDTTTKKIMKNVVSSKAAQRSNPVESNDENSDLHDCDSSETDPDEKNKHTKNKKTEAVNKKTISIAKNKAEVRATDKEFTSDEVSFIIDKSEKDQPLSPFGFLLSLISHALQGGDSVRQMFEEPKVKTFVKGIISPVSEIR